MSQPVHIWTEAEEEKRGRDTGESLHRGLAFGGSTDAYRITVETYENLLAAETDPAKRAFYRAALSKLPGIDKVVE